MTSATPPPGEVLRGLTGRDYLSWSAITVYRQCPLKFYFQYVAGLPERSVPSSLVFGGAVHKVIEHHYRELLEGGTPPGPDTLLGVYEAAWREADDKAVKFARGQSRESLLTLAGRMLRAFCESDLARPAGSIAGIEEELRGALSPGVPDLLSRLDLLVDDGGGLTVTDFKTCRGPRVSLGGEEQLLLYHELARGLSEGPVVLRLAVLTKAVNLRLHLQPVFAEPAALLRVRLVVERVWESIACGHFYPSPSPVNCPACPFRRECREWAG